MPDDPHDSANRGFWSADDIQAQLRDSQKAKEEASRFWCVWAVVGAMVALVALLWALAARAEPAKPSSPQTPACSQWKELVDTLGDMFGETRRGIGVVGDSVAELYTSERGTFTILMTKPDGTACVLVFGQGWEIIPAGDPA